ncbi:MFS transporter [Nocardioides sp.]|uniref:MFS transporter n=1 Tax=Nocardioides sp. TaxID=35761 RepID=UPI002CF4D798|nr:MFS transporter [Nocardioides sp.]HVX52999.1 MFS transporter [Nocardioides sp.]
MTGAHLRGRYPIAVAIALLGLCPNTVVSTSFLPLESRLQQDLGAGRVAVGVVLGLSSAGYAVGAVLAAQRVLRHTARRVFLGGELLFVVASAASALAPDLPVFALGRVLAGLAAGAMLISALPPLVTRFGAARVALSAAIVNVGLFGVSALGPLIGGLVTGGDGWRWLLGATALLGLIGLAVAHDGYEPFDPPEPERPVDVTALLLVVVATVATFLAASLVAGSSVRAPEVWLPFVIGMIALAALLAVEVRRHDALIPVSALTTQLPVTGLIVAMVGGACFVATAELLQTQLMTGRSAAQAALLFWPAPVGAALASVAFWRLFATRWVPVLVDVGLVALAGGVVLLLTDSSTPAAVLPAVLLLGIGAGATVSPGLFLIGLGMPSQQLGRAFALVQLLRSMATYAVAPIVVAVAPGHDGFLAMAVVAAAGLIAALAVPALSGARLRAPDIEAWLAGDKALPSPPTGTHVRPGVDATAEDDAEPLLPERLRRH